MEPHDLNKINKSFGELNLEDEFDLDDLGCYPFEQSNDTHTQTPNTSTPTRVERTAADEEARKPKSVRPRPRPVPSHQLQFVLTPTKSLSAKKQDVCPSPKNKASELGKILCPKIIKKINLQFLE